MAKIIIEIDDELKRKFVVKLAKEDKTQKDVIIEFIEGYVNKEKM